MCLRVFECVRLCASACMNVYVLSPTHLPKCRHARPVKVSHCAAVNDDVADVCTSHRRVVFLFSTVTVLVNSLAILQHVHILPCIVNGAICPGMCCINTSNVFYFVLQHIQDTLLISDLASNISFST